MYLCLVGKPDCVKRNRDQNDKKGISGRTKGVRGNRKCGSENEKGSREDSSVIPSV